MFDISGTENNRSTLPNENNKDIIKNPKTRRNAPCSNEISFDNELKYPFDNQKGH